MKCTTSAPRPTDTAGEASTVNSPCSKGRSVTIKKQTRAVAGSSSLRRA